MSNRPITFDAKMQVKVCDEVREKTSHYESRMSNRLNLWVEAASLYTGKSFTQSENSKLCPNSTELYRSCRALANMKYRMLTSQKPFFELEPLDLIGYADPKNILISEHYVTNQLDLARYPKGLYRTLLMLELYGTAAVHQQFEPLRKSYLGSKRWYTSFRPVSLINCAFSLDSFDLDDSGWTIINDVQARNTLVTLILNDPDGKLYNHAKIQSILNGPDYTPQVNNWVRQRMAWSGYTESNFKGGIERSTYYGPLDCKNDGENYAIDIVNREAIIRSETTEGLLPVRVCTQNSIDVEPLGNGLGDQFRPILGQLDNVRSSLLNTITLAGANMFTKQKGAMDEDLEFQVRNLGILNLENPDLKSLSPNPSSIVAQQNYEMSLTQQYRQSAGTPDIMQAVVGNYDSTATEVSLSMNEAVRNASVGAELVAPVLVGDTIKVILQNAQKYQTEPFTLVINKTPVTIAPSKLLCDSDVRCKTMTDQDFRPSKVNRLMGAASLIVNTPPNALTGVKLDVTPTIIEALKLLDVPNYEQTVQKITEQDMIRANVMAQMGAIGGQPVGPVGQPGGIATPNRPEMAGPKNAVSTNTLRTPVGAVLAGPGDQQDSLNTIRSSNG